MTALTGAGVASQVAYPLLRGEALRRLTIGSVATVCAAAVTETWRRSGPRGGLTALAVAGGVGLLAEAVGTRTGRVFGAYRYAGTLGPQAAGVPLVVPLAWTMTAAPAVVLGRRLAQRLPPGTPRPVRDAVAVGTAAWTLASWDLFLDPQMTAAGHWTFDRPRPHLPGVPGIPLTNYAGWAGVALAMCGLLHAGLPADRPGSGHAVPAALLGWTWLGSTLANATFFRRPVVAAYGGIAMGLTVGPYLRESWRNRSAG
ncbi:carotenoid biosynthesis protein [Kineococcus sp. SYSU DK001]|uniref:carotenoid biosynthesis protein n=1 Tax=Kineococcus sp. SYSU DK001 TaxID=3383122 RepID=UPI003D7D698D